MRGYDLTKLQADNNREIYTQLQKDGAPRHKLASLTDEAVNMPPRTIRRWGYKRQLEFTLTFNLKYIILYTIERSTL